MLGRDEQSSRACVKKVLARQQLRALPGGAAALTTCFENVQQDPRDIADATRTARLLGRAALPLRLVLDAVRAIVAPALGRAVTAATLGGAHAYAGRSVKSPASA